MHAERYEGQLEGSRLREVIEGFGFTPAELAAHWQEAGCAEGFHHWATVGKGNAHNQEGFIYCAYCYEGYNGGHFRIGC